MPTDLLPHLVTLDKQVAHGLLDHRPGILKAKKAQMVEIQCQRVIAASLHHWQHDTLGGVHLLMIRTLQQTDGQSNTLG